MRTKLKIGDRVKVIKVGFNNQECLNKEGIIIQINKERLTAPYMLEGKEFGKYSCWSIEALELVKQLNKEWKR